MVTEEEIQKWVKELLQDFADQTSTGLDDAGSYLCKVQFAAGLQRLNLLLGIARLEHSSFCWQVLAEVFGIESSKVQHGRPFSSPRKAQAADSNSSKIDSFLLRDCCPDFAGYHISMSQ